MNLLNRFDSWVQSGPFKPLDLGIYRIVYACSALAIVPNIEWLANYPDSMYQAPAGPFQLLSGFPPMAVLIGLDVARSVALVLLAIGMWVRWASFAVGALLLITYGLSYTLGKIDHTILLVLTPVILSFASWGDRLSVDSLRRRVEPRPTPQWPLRFLALAIGLAFFEAAAIKFGSGWLSLSSQAVRGHFLDNMLGNERSGWLSSTAANTRSWPLWESLDWATVIFEGSILVTVCWWRAFRIALAFATLFHFGVFMIMNIPFTPNLVVYGAFVSWGAFESARRRHLKVLETLTSKLEHYVSTVSDRTLVAAATVSAVVMGVVVWRLTAITNLFSIAVDRLFICGGAALGVGYLGYRIIQLGLMVTRIGQMKNGDGRA